MLSRYMAFLLARRCEFDSSARLLLQIWEQGGGSDLTTDRLTHFLILSLDTGRARSWSSSDSEAAASGIHDCTAGASTCPDISPPLPAAAACDRNWGEYSGGASSRAIASTAAAARKLLHQVRFHPPFATFGSCSSRQSKSLAAQRRLSVNGNSSRCRIQPPVPLFASLMPLQGWSCVNHRHGRKFLVFCLHGQHGQCCCCCRHHHRVHRVCHRLVRCTPTSPMPTSSSTTSVSLLQPSTFLSLDLSAGMDALQREVVRSWRQVQVPRCCCTLHTSPSHASSGYTCSPRRPPAQARVKLAPLRLEAYHHEVPRHNSFLARF